MPLTTTDTSRMFSLLCLHWRFLKKSWRGSTCFCNKVQRGDSRLEASTTQVQADGEWLASAHNQTVHAVQVRAVVHVVEQVLQVPAVDVQSFGKKRETFNESRCLVYLKSYTYFLEIHQAQLSYLHTHSWIMCCICFRCGKLLCNHCIICISLELLFGKKRPFKGPAWTI